MKIPVEYQVFIGSSIVSLLFLLKQWIKDHKKNKDAEPQRLAVLSIILGLLIIVPFLSVLGLLLAIISVIIKKNKRLSKIAIVLNILTMLPWIAVVAFGA